jgi:zinc protease
VTPEDVRRAATTRLTPDRLVVVVAGDVSKIEASIRARNLGEVEVWDAQGNKLR